MWLAKKILVPTDFAESSRAACDLGLEFARQFRVPLVLMHVYPVPTTINKGVPFLPIGDYVQLIEDSAQSALNNEAARLRDRGAEVATALMSTVLKSGNAWEEILDAVKKLDVGLVVMGTHGRRGLPRALLGSVAERVVLLSPVPVLTVHGPEKE
jgi:nucleotide-binding universal stress UspA family protein